MQWHCFLVTSLVLQLPGQFFPTVAMNKFLSDWCEGLIHPSSFGKIICQYEKTEVLQSDQGKRTSLVKICSTLCRIKGTSAGVNQWSRWDNDSLHSFHPLQRSDQLAVSLRNVDDWKLEPGRHLRPCVFKILRCGCCCVTTARKPLWLRLRFAARLSKACCSASIHNRSMTFSRVLDFCYASRDSSPTSLRSWSSRLLAVASPRKASGIVVTSSKWWSRLNEIKEVYRVELHFQYRSAHRHSIAKLSASWDLFACSLPEIACWGPVKCRLKFVYISRKSGILYGLLFAAIPTGWTKTIKESSSIFENSWAIGVLGIGVLSWGIPRSIPTAWRDL